jgi:hypothetical protein
MTSGGAATNDRPRTLHRASVNVATVIAGGVIGALVVLLWGAMQPARALVTNSVNPTAMIIEPFVIPWLVWVVGIGGGLFHAAAILKYHQRI